MFKFSHPLHISKEQRPLRKRELLCWGEEDGLIPCALGVIERGSSFFT